MYIRVYLNTLASITIYMQLISTRGVTLIKVFKVFTNPAGESSSRVSRNIPVDSLVSDIAQELCEQKPTIPEVNEDLAGVLNRRWATKISDKDLSEKFDLIQRPENFSGLIRLRVNSKILSNLDK